MPETIHLVPLPVRLEERDGSFTLTPRTRILADEEEDTQRIARLLAERLRPATGLPLPVETYKGSANDAIVLTTNGADAGSGDEGYTLNATPQGVAIRAKKPAGLFYGMQTLRQLLPPAIEGSERTEGVEWSIPCVSIVDAPRFPVRGFMLDSCRHLQSVDYIKRTLDCLALYKINTFHWHLTEDQGWRIEIRLYPMLTEVGAWRGEGEERYGGFFTQDEIRDVVAYAAERFITVIPEVDMPGHMMSALASYPELGCTGGPYKVRTEWGIEDDVMCAGRESTFQFVEDVLTEVMDLFPSKVIHIGGDESPRARWKECPHCQERIRAEGLADEDALQNYFTRRVMAFLRDHGRRLQGWNEITKGGELPNDVIVHAWVWENAVSDAAKAGNWVLDSMHKWLYFDWPYGATPMRKTYEHEPVPEGLTPSEQAKVIGAQANLWTEHHDTEADADEFTWPRILAVAEMTWSQRDARNWDDFRRRVLTDQCDRLARLGAGSAEDLKSRVDVPENAPPPY